MTAKKSLCNLAVCKAEGKEDVWYITHNLEDTWTEDLLYAKKLYLCIFIAYSWIIILDISCSKDKKNKLLGEVKRTRNKKKLESITFLGLD